MPDAVVLEEVSYEEATELAYFGAQVVHPSTMAPAIDEQDPDLDRNTFNPSCARARRFTKRPHREPVKGFATVDGMALVNVEGTGMIGVPGVAHRLFGALRDVGVSVVMISQAQFRAFDLLRDSRSPGRPRADRPSSARSSPSSITDQIQMIGVTEDCSILAAVGDNMVDHPGVAGKFFTALGQAPRSTFAPSRRAPPNGISRP